MISATLSQEIDRWNDCSRIDRGAEIRLTANLPIADVLRTSLLGGSIGIIPMAVGVVCIKTNAAVLGVTLDTGVNMVAAKVLSAAGTWLAGDYFAYGTQLLVGLRAIRLRGRGTEYGL